jgi:hypothetical protein
MSKKKIARKSHRPHVARRVFLGGLDPIKLVEMLDDKFQDNGAKDGSPYRRLYVQTLKALLKRSSPDAINFKALLDGIDGAGCEVETAMCNAGFVVGFEVCRQLLLGELDLPALKGGA